MNTRPKQTISIVWFRQDLRLEDNAALAAAVSRGGLVVPLFIWSPDEDGEWPPGTASRWWLHHSLTELAASLERAGSGLVVRSGDSQRVIRSIVKETGAAAVYLNRRYEPAPAERDRRVMAALASEGVDVYAFDDSLLFDPDAVKNRAGTPFKVFTPFWKHLLTRENPGIRLPRPQRIPSPDSLPTSRSVDRLRLPRRFRGAQGLLANWTPGEDGGHNALRLFLEDSVDSYDTRRDLPGVRGTSLLSPHLHFGEVNPRRAWYDVQRRTRRKNGGDADPFLRQLAWREFSHYLLFHFPESASAPLRQTFSEFPWREDENALRAWKDGQTGYPIVDAGMRELRATGWMHNRVRMIAASFLVKHLLVHWLEGANWFWENLVDADLANNTMGWQWIAGCGADAAPYFRIFNPVKQGRAFDPDGAYIRKWLPELSDLPDEHIHTPWKTPEAILENAGLLISYNYPEPLIDHAAGRDRALAAYQSFKTRQPYAA